MLQGTLGVKMARVLEVKLWCAYIKVEKER
jgi:hypothetical protein